MNAPDLNRSLLLEAPSQIADGAGGFGLSWTAIGTLWGEVSAGSGRDVAGVEIVLATVPYRVTVRGAPVGSPRRPRPEQRFRDGTRIYTILAVTERDPDGQYLTCFTREEVPQ
ncbi:MAG: head-tail adaptor protein [Candidatus Saccharibacteria bacterium]|nr:head-tail adaptor protein [Pseudorhodobacter sp.]